MSFFERLTIKINNAYVGTRKGRRLGVKWIDPHASK